MELLNETTIRSCQYMLVFLTTNLPNNDRRLFSVLEFVVSHGSVLNMENLLCAKAKHGAERGKVVMCVCVCVQPKFFFKNPCECVVFQRGLEHGRFSVGCFSVGFPTIASLVLAAFLFCCWSTGYRFCAPLESLIGFPVFLQCVGAWVPVMFLVNALLVGNGSKSGRPLRQAASHGPLTKIACA